MYELVGEAGLPAPFMESRGVVALEGPNHTYDLFVPFSNPQVGSKLYNYCCIHCTCPQPLLLPTI